MTGKQAKRVKAAYRRVLNADQPWHWKMLRTVRYWAAWQIPHRRYDELMWALGEPA